MERAVELALLDEALARIAERRTDVGDSPATATLGVGRFTDAARLAREQATLFRKIPLAVGFASQVAEPGSFLTHHETQVPILVSRDKDGVLRAFVNVCRHRGTLLEGEACGAQKKLFVCPYHAWSYDLTGRLRGVPHDGNFPGLVKEERGLVPLPVAERGGLVFVVPDPPASDDATVDFDAFLGELGTELAAFQSHVLFAPSRRVRKLNWKLMMDSSFETYHFRQVHEQTIYPLFHDNTGVFAWREPHCRMVLPKRSIATLPERPREEWKIREHANLIYGVFPNVIALVQPDHVMVVTTWPIDTDTSAITAGMLIPEAPTTDRALRHWQKNEQIFWTAIEEDITTTERIQKTLRARPQESFLLGAHEHLIASFHAAVDRVIA